MDYLIISFSSEEADFTILSINMLKKLLANTYFRDRLKDCE